MLATRHAAQVLAEIVSQLSYADLDHVAKLSKRRHTPPVNGRTLRTRSPRARPEAGPQVTHLAVEVVGPCVLEIHRRAHRPNRPSSTLRGLATSTHVKRR
jgi:hypothetical protein